MPLKNLLLSSLIVLVLGGCSVRILTFNDSSTSSKPYDFRLLDIDKNKGE